jgi:hypothetical protein
MLPANSNSSVALWTSVRNAMKDALSVWRDHESLERAREESVFPWVVVRMDSSALADICFWLGPPSSRPDTAAPHMSSRIFKCLCRFLLNPFGGLPVVGSRMLWFTKPVGTRERDHGSTAKFSSNMHGRDVRAETAFSGDWTVMHRRVGSSSCWRCWRLGFL